MLRARASRKSQTDLRRVRRTIGQSMVRDGDAPEWTAEMFARAVTRKGLTPVPEKALPWLRIDAGVAEWIKSQRSGYQSSMNALLPLDMQAHR